VSPQTLAGGTEVRILVRQPGEVLASPDARVLIAEAGGRNEGGDAGLLQVEVVERRPVLGVCHGSGNGVLAQPTMLLANFRQYTNAASCAATHPREGARDGVASFAMHARNSHKAADEPTVVKE